MKIMDHNENKAFLPVFAIPTVTLLTSLFMFHLISFSAHLVVHVSSHFLQSTLD